MVSEFVNYTKREIIKCDLEARLINVNNLIEKYNWNLDDVIFSCDMNGNSRVWYINKDGNMTPTHYLDLNQEYKNKIKPLNEDEIKSYTFEKVS